MRTIEYDAYGAVGVLRSRDVAEPAAPAAGELRVRVDAASVNPKDTFVRKGRFAAMMSPAFPKRSGYDWSGVVESVGEGVTAFTAGDRAFGMIEGWEGRTCAEIVTVSAAESALAPPGAGAHELAAIPLAALTALQALSENATLEGRSRVFVSGASGGVGLFAVQIARALGANVTASASDVNEELCREAGAEDFIDYRATNANSEGAHYDVIFDVFGNLLYEDASEKLTERGVFVSTVPNKATFAAVASTRTSEGRRARLVVVESRARDLERLAAMLTQGMLRAHVDRVYPLAELAAAHAHVESKHTRGKVVVAIR